MNKSVDGKAGSRNTEEYAKKSSGDVQYSRGGADGDQGKVGMAKTEMERVAQESGSASSGSGR